MGSLPPAALLRAASDEAVPLLSANFESTRELRDHAHARRWSTLRRVAHGDSDRAPGTVRFLRWEAPLPYRYSVCASLIEPDLFDAWIAISPSLWWDDEAVIRQAETFFDGASGEPRGFLYMTIGNEGGRMLAGVWGLARVLETHAPPTFRWGFDVLEQEDHGSVPLRSTYAGFERLYEGWRLENPVEFAAENGLPAVDAHFAALSERYGYEIRTPESVINNIGYGLLAMNRVDDAIVVLRSNVERHARSANVHDSLGDAYAAAGEWELARESYARAVSRGREIGDPNLFAYERNLENMREKVDH